MAFRFLAGTPSDRVRCAPAAAAHLTKECLDGRPHECAGGGRRAPPPAPPPPRRPTSQRNAWMDDLTNAPAGPVGLHDGLPLGTDADPDTDAGAEPGHDLEVDVDALQHQVRTPPTEPRRRPEPRRTPVEIRALGQLELSHEGHRLTVRRGKAGQVLALLVARSGEIVSVETLVDDLWGEAAPRSVSTTLQTYVYHLRKMVAQELRVEQPEQFVVTCARGYRL